jgi:aldose 1-epimerase
VADKGVNRSIYCLLIVIAAMTASCAMPHTEAQIAAAPSSTSPPTREHFGTLPDGRSVEQFRLENSRGTQVELLTYGAAIASIRLARQDGPPVEVVVGPAQLEPFTKRRFGQIVGRYAGRLRGDLLITGKRYRLATNAAGVTVHGGDPGLDRELWQATPFADESGSGVTFELVSPDGQQGFPATLTLRARYHLDRASDTLTLDIHGTADRATVVNLTNHVFFNLAGEGTIACHTLQADASRYVEIDKRKLPTGLLPSVHGTRFDFTRARPLGTVLPQGLDDMIVLNRDGNVHLTDLEGGRAVTISTNQPGVQLFTGNGFDGTLPDQRGRPILRHAGIALEPMGLPDSPWISHFPSTSVTPERPLHWKTRWSFSSTQPKPGSCAG